MSYVTVVHYDVEVILCVKLAVLHVLKFGSGEFPRTVVLVSPKFLGMSSLHAAAAAGDAPTVTTLLRTCKVDALSAVSVLSSL